MFEFLLQRQHEEPPPSPKDHRHPTERDRDRILHSSAFRRLQGKTQVFGIGQADFYRTRLTHSIETAQLARAIANNMLVEEPQLASCVTEELAEAVALAHDLGHPPFGHAGEKSLDACMRDISSRTPLHGKGILRFEGNAQTFHVLVVAEPKSPSYPGLNLTRATLSGVMKYPYEQDTDNSRFIFTSDADVARWALRDAPGLITVQQRNEGVAPQTTFVCQILDWADDCAYSIHDIEDALQAQFLRPGDLTDPGFAYQVLRHYDETRENEAVPPLSREELAERLRALKRRILPPEKGDARAHRKEALRNILNELVTEVTVQPRPGANRPDYAWTLNVPVESRILSALCKAIIWEAVITDPRVAAMSTKGKEVLHDLFYLLLAELVERKSYALFPRYYRPIIEESMDRGEAEAARGVCNFLALLTDMDALRLHSLLRGSKASSVFDLL
jgi:dGTPase